MAVYCPSSVHTTQNDWDYVFSLTSSNSLILGDFNAHHSNWSYRTDQRGRQIFESMLENNFIYLNNGDPTRVRLVNGSLQQSSPDISFVSTEVSTLFTWKATNESLGSDHLIIKLGVSYNTSRVTIKRRNFKKSDWNAYSSYIENSLPDINNSACPQELYNKFEYTVQTAANRFIPYKIMPQHLCTKFNPKPYWNTELSKAVAERRLALANLRRNPSPANLDTLQEKISQAQRLIRLAKNKSWQGFCSSIGETSSPSDMWRNMRWVEGHQSNPNSNRAIDKDKAEQLLTSLCPDSTCPPQPNFNSINATLESDVTLQELEHSIKKSDTAPGTDDISFSMIFHLPLIAKTYLIKLYNIFLHTGFVPTQWRQTKIIPIPKPGKDLHSQSALRPISLISCPCKVFHSILNKRIEWFLEKHGIFPNNMTGFRKGRSSFDNLTHLVSYIQIGFSKHLITAACFIDIENAYNNVEVNCLLSILDQLGIGSKICMYLWSYLKDRRLTISVEGSDIVRSTGCGLAQGDPLSPLLFNAATSNICKNIQNE